MLALTRKALALVLVAGLVSACTKMVEVTRPDTTNLRPALSLVLQIDSGNYQSAVAGDTLPKRLVVTVKDSATGTAVSGTDINWVVVDSMGHVLNGSGYGYVFVWTTKTNGSGHSSNQWTLGAGPLGNQYLEARAIDSLGNLVTYARFTATATNKVDTLPPAPEVFSMGPVGPPTTYCDTAATVKCGSVSATANADTVLVTDEQLTVIKRTSSGAYVTVADYQPGFTFAPMSGTDSTTGAGWTATARLVAVDSSKGDTYRFTIHFTGSHSKLGPSLSVCPVVEGSAQAVCTDRLFPLWLY